MKALLLRTHMYVGDTAFLKIYIYICNFYGIKKKQFNSSELKKESEKSFELTLQDKLECLVKVFYN